MRSKSWGLRGNNTPMGDFPRDAKLPSTSAAPIAPRCCLTEQNEGSVPQLLGDADFWRAMCPQLHVADAATQARFEPLQLGAAERDALTKRVAREGFYQLQQLPALAALHTPLALGVVQLAQVRRCPQAATHTHTHTLPVPLLLQPR